MKELIILLVAAAVTCSCGHGPAARRGFTVEVMNKITPVKNQGRGPLCWIYAMLATVESDRLMQGDSVNLSAVYVARRVLEAGAERMYLSQGLTGVAADGMAPRALSALAEYGVVTYDAYRSDCNFNAVGRRLESIARTSAARRVGLGHLRSVVADALDAAVNPVPRKVWLYGAEYTPQEFAASVCLPSDYEALTSYTHEPFGSDVVLAVPANREGYRFRNVPVDTLVGRVVGALRSGRSVCWEGDISNDGFSFERGVAELPKGSPVVTQAARQQAFERFSVTDDHCMAIVGLARDAAGRRWFICKNSWGTDNPYGGLMYMSEQYFRLNTLAVVMLFRS